MTETDARRVDAEIANLIANAQKLQVETVKLQKEAAKLGRESSWYPFVVGSGVTLAIAAIVKLFL